MEGIMAEFSDSLKRWAKSTGVLMALALSLAIMPSALSQQQGSFEAKSRAIELYNESIGLFNAGNYESCEARLAEANRLDPDNHNILNNYGLVLLKMGQLPLARKLLERALSVNPNNELACLNLGLVCEGLGDLPAAKTYLSRYVGLTKNREQAEKIKDHVDIIEKTLASGAGGAGLASDNYLGQIDRSKLFPWPKERMPLKIFIEEGKNVPGYKDSYGVVLENAVDSWARVLDGIVSFQRVKDEQSADIVVKWANDYRNALMKAEGGDCRYTANGAGMNHADITILTLDPSPTDKLNEFKVAWVALHEFGHALGVNGHSNNPQDVMYFSAPLKNAMPDLSAADVKTFTRLYTEKLADTWLTLNEAGLKAMRVGNLDLAIQKFEQAIKMNASEKVLRQNLSLAVAKKASEQLDNGDYKNAELSLNRALAIESEFRTQTFDILLSNYALLLKRSGRSKEVAAMYKRYAAQEKSQ